MNSYKMDKAYLSNLFKETKILKSERILVSNNIIYGSNLDYTIIKKIFRNTSDFTYISFISKDMEAFIRNIEKINETEVIVNPFSLVCGDYSVEINNIFQQNKLLEMYQKFVVSTISNCDPIIEIKDVKEYMNNVLQCKAAEKDLIKIDKDHIMIMHGSMLPINKSDKVSLHIIKYNEVSSIYKYTIYKNKYNPIEVYMLCLNID